jgi:hypothetical protein
MVALLVLVSTGSTRPEGGWALWAKSSNLWGSSLSPSSGSLILTFPTKDECLSKMEQVMNEVAAWNIGRGIQVTRDGSTLNSTDPESRPNPPRPATVEYSCVPDNRLNSRGG